MSEAALKELSALPPAPPHLVLGGAPQEGLYAGAIADPSFTGLSAPFAWTGLERRLVEKKWQYLFVAHEEIMLALAILDVGYLSTGICAVFDRGSRRLLIDDSPVLPPLFASVGERPGEATLRGPGIKASIEKNGDRWLARASWAHCEVDLTLDAANAPLPMTAVATIDKHGRFDFTQKNTLLKANGYVRTGNVSFEVRDAPAGLDYTHGFFARQAEWRWAFAAGPLVAFNFSEGFLGGAGENVVWLDGEPRPAGKIAFEFDKLAPLAPWRIRGEAVDLVFKPEGLRAKTIDLKLILSRYLQPFGSFEGHVLGATVSGLAGVTEDHTARW
jgi:hypothetical protein